MASGLLLDYMGTGPIASRPASPTLHTGTLGLWYADDTGVLSAWDGSVWADVSGAVDSVNGQTGAVVLDAADLDYDNSVSGLAATDIQAAIDEIAAGGGGSDTLTLVVEPSTSTMSPSTHGGLSKLVLAADDVTFNTSQSYTAGDVFNICATAALELLETGVTLTPPAGGTLELDADMSATVVMTSSSAGRVIGQTVPA